MKTYHHAIHISRRPGLASIVSRFRSARGRDAWVAVSPALRCACEEPADPSGFHPHVFETALGDVRGETRALAPGESPPIALAPV
jgi:hypothetical protein